MQGLTAEPMKGCWYLVMTGEALARGQLQGVTLAGEPVLLARGTDGAVFAMRNTCPHRGIPLHYGRLVDNTVQCCYHGWRFDQAGVCVEVPSLAPEQTLDLSKIRCPSYRAVERFGVIWVYVPRAGETAQPEALPALPPLPDLPADSRPCAAVSMAFPCSADHAAFGLMDPTHAAYVHRSWWFKKNAAKLRLKEKHFEPTALGFRMKRHQVPPQNVLYRRLLGHGVSTEISYELPGFRIEHIRGDRHWAVGLTAITPQRDDQTIVHHLIWSSLPWLRPLGPIARHFMRVFLGQDRDVCVKQREGLVSNPKLMLIADADTQARWWMRLKDEWMAAQAENRSFTNPLREQTFRWRS